MTELSVIQILRQEGIEFTDSGKNVSRHGGWIGVQCPYCNDETNHLGINLQSLAIKCWKCGKKGHFTNYLWTKLGKNATKYKVEKEVSVIQNLNRNRPKQIEMPGSGLTNTHRAYLVSRNFRPDEMILQYGVRSALSCSPFAFRILIPYYYNNQLVCYSGRTHLSNVEPRYLHLRVEECVRGPKETLYNIDSVENGVCLIVEGVTDVWRLGKGAIALSGNNITPEQTTILLHKKIKRAVIALDPGAEEQAEQVAQTVAMVVDDVEILDTASELGEDESDFGSMAEQKVAMIRSMVF